MKKYDLTQGGILSRLLLVAIPIMGTQLIQMTYNLTDMFWLGRLSSDAVAASGTAGMYMWLSMAFLMIGRMGAEIGVSQNLGRNDEASAKKYSQNSLFLAACFGLFCALSAVLFSRELISFFNIQEEHVAADAAAYLRIVGLACPATFISSAIVGSFNGSGNSRLSFIANASGLVINMILDPLLIFIFDMGIFGAAVATGIAQAAVMTIFLIAIKKNRERPFETYKFFVKPSADIISQILKWSLPIALESLLFTVLAMITTRFVTAFGSGAIAVQRVGSQVESLSWLIGGGFGSAVTAFIGQNYGAGKWTRIGKGYRISLAAMLCWGLAVTAILFFGGRLLFSLFLPDEALLGMGEMYLKILAFCQVAACLEAVSAGAFRGIGKTIPPSFISITGNAIRVPIAYLLSLTPLGLNGIWLGVTIGASLRGLAIVFCYMIANRKHPKSDTEPIEYKFEEVVQEC